MLELEHALGHPMGSRIVILNYNGEKLLGQYLPSVLEASRQSKAPCRVTVIDNVSQDRSLEILRRDFPQVEIYRAKENRVLCSFNEYLERMSEPVALLLNNDIRVEAGFVDPLVEPFENDPDLFMVTPRCLSFDGGRYEGGRCRSQIKFGLFWSASVFPGHEKHIQQAGFTMAAGFGAFDRKKFLELGGYDDLYLPGRLEDNDLCFRAWQRGWKCFYEPRSVVYHQGAASFNERFGAKKTLMIGHRNSFLFFWKNMTDIGYWLEHFLFLLPRLFFAALTGKPELAIAFFKALPLLPQALMRRRKSGGEKKVRTDREIFAMVR